MSGFKGEERITFIRKEERQSMPLTIATRPEGFEPPTGGLEIHCSKS